MVTRAIMIIVHGPNHFDVQEGERYVDHLGWDEMLGQIAELTHPSINRDRYVMLTPEGHAERRERFKSIAASTENFKQE